MPTNPFNFGAAAQTALDNILQNALPVLLLSTVKDIDGFGCADGHVA